MRYMFTCCCCDDPDYRNISKEQAEKILNEVDEQKTSYYLPRIRWAKVVGVYDGDTVTVLALLSDGQVYKYKVRMAGYDCAEMKTKNVEEKNAAVEARDVLKERCLHKIVEIRVQKFDKYGRLLCELIDEDGNINDWMVDEKYGVPYDGGTKEEIDWKHFRDDIVQVHRNRKRGTCRFCKLLLDYIIFSLFSCISFFLIFILFSHFYSLEIKILLPQEIFQFYTQNVYNTLLVKQFLQLFENYVTGPPMTRDVPIWIFQEKHHTLLTF